MSSLILTLPHELLLLTFQTLGPGDLLSLMLTTRRFAATASTLLSNHAYREGLPPLHWAAKTGDYRLASFILRNTEVNLTERVPFEYVDKARYLLQYPVVSRHSEYLQDYGCTAFFVACWSGHEDVVRLLLQRIDMDPESAQVLHLPCCGILIPECIDTGDYPSCQIRKFTTALQAAASMGHSAIVALIVSRPGEDVDSIPNVSFSCARNSPISTMTALQCASQNGHLSTVHLLVSAGAEVDRGTMAYGLTALHFAAQNGKTEVVRFLLEKGAAVDGKPAQRTPLYYAAQNDYLETAKVLLEAGADAFYGCLPELLSPAMVAQSREMIDLLNGKWG